MILLLLLLLIAPDCAAQTKVFTSPQGRVSVTLDAAGSLHIALRDTPVVEVSDMGLDIVTPAGTTVRSKNCWILLANSSHDSTYHLQWGENKTLRDCYNELTLQSHGFLLRLRLFDEGVAWRYEYADVKGALLRGETTHYRWASDATCWSIPANFESYESAYREQPLSRTTDANTPMTLHLANGVWASLHEAALYAMPEMTLVRDTSASDSLTFRTWLAPSADSTLGYGYRLEKERLTTSWRTLTLGREAVDLINGNLTLHLNPSSPAADTHRYRPIKFIGIWWGMHLGIQGWVPDSRHGATTERTLQYIDFAAAHNIDGVLVEGWNRGWEQWGGTQMFDYLHTAPDFDLQRVADYARHRGVELILHHETGGNIPHYEEQMEQAFSLCQQLGVHYVKTGYAGGFPNREIHHSRYGVEHYQRVTECAACHHVALDVHEPIKPTGLCRTYPNLMTAEGARGMEWNAWSEGNSPEHTTILPFTRLLAGPMDYTPGIFDVTYQCLKRYPEGRQWNQRPASSCRVHTTLAKQCALWVVLYSPWVMAADLIENYDGHPMFDFFRQYNPDCDESRTLAGEPGRYAVVLRRAGEKYFLGAVTNSEARNLFLPLDFLPPRETGYQVTVYGDGEGADYQGNPTAYRITTHLLHPTDTLQLHLAPGGGAAVMIH